jgi:hypothetical protein
MFLPDDMAKLEVLSDLVDRWVLRHWRVLRRPFAPSKTRCGSNHCCRPGRH